MDLAGKRVLVTGGTGFLGKAVCSELQARHCEVIAIGRKHCDLTLDDSDAAYSQIWRHRPNIIIHLAAVVGGIGANKARPADFFRDNMMMGLNLITAAASCCQHAGYLQKLICVGTVCSYPALTKVPFKEEDLWDGYPETTNAPYGIAKKALLVYLQAARAQYGLNGIYLMPANLYGPHDSLNLSTNHVIPALIKKFSDAKASGSPSVELWGTGAATREFLYVTDCAKGIIAAAENYDHQDPVNLGTGQEISICDLATLIKAEIGFNGKIEWNPTMPDGQPRRSLDTTRAQAAFGWTATTDLQTGIKHTIDWYHNLAKHS